MPLRGEIHRPGQPNSPFELADPELGKMMLRHILLEPNIFRIIIWAPNHIIGSGGAGRAYLKYEEVGLPADTANLPVVGSTGTLTDSETGVFINLERT